MPITYQEYMAADKCDPETGHYCGWLAAKHHNDFYAQFVSEAHKRAILEFIGRDAIVASRDPHFNDIPLAKWDRLPRILNAEKVKALGGNLSISTFTCVYKQAARHLQKEIAPEVKTFRASREYARLGDDPRHIIHDFAKGANEAEAMENLKRFNRGQGNFQLYGESE